MFFLKLTYYLHELSNGGVLLSEGPHFDYGYGGEETGLSFLRSACYFTVPNAPIIGLHSRQKKEKKKQKK